MLKFEIFHTSLFLYIADRLIKRHLDRLLGGAQRVHLVWSVPESLLEMVLGGLIFEMWNGASHDQLKPGPVLDLSRADSAIVDETFRLNVVFGGAGLLDELCKVFHADTVRYDQMGRFDARRISDVSGAKIGKECVKASVDLISVLWIRIS